MLASKLSNVGAAICLALIVIEHSTAAAADVLPSPESLIYGLEETRTSLVSGRLSIVLETFVPRIEAPDKLMRLEVVFDGKKRWFAQSSTMVTIQAHSNVDLKSKEKLLSTYASDYDTLVKKHEAQWKLISFKSFFDGKDAYVYSKDYGAKLVDFSRGTPWYFFDVRCLGFDDILRSGHDIKESFKYYEEPTKYGVLSTIGKEVIDNTECWHVMGQFKTQKRDYWIDDKTFNIYKFQLTHQSGVNTVISHYDASHPLPSEVELVSVNLVGKTTAHQKLKVLEQHLNSPVLASRFSLKGLEMPKGQRVDDIRNGLVTLGFWNGETLQESRISDERGSRATGTGRGAAIIIIMNGAVLIIVAIFFYRRRPDVSDN